MLKYYLTMLFSLTLLGLSGCTSKLNPEVPQLNLPEIPKVLQEPLKEPSYQKDLLDFLSPSQNEQTTIDES